MIPKRFKLLSQTIDVIIDDLRCKDKDSVGATHYVNNKIILASTCDGENIPEDSKELTFYHELVHQVLHKMGDDKLNKDERFVELMAGLLHQAHITFEYE